MDEKANETDHARIVFTMRDGKRFVQTLWHEDCAAASMIVSNMIQGGFGWHTFEEQGDSFAINVNEVATIQITAW